MGIVKKTPDDVEAMAIMAYTLPVLARHARSKVIVELLGEPKMTVTAAERIADANEDLREMFLEAARAKAAWYAYLVTEGKGGFTLPEA